MHPFRPFAPLLLCLAHTGIRLGEAFGLRWSDIDWRAGILHVRRSYSHGRLDVPKGGKERKVELSQRLRGALRAVYEARFERVAALDPEQQAALEAESAAGCRAHSEQGVGCGVAAGGGVRRRLSHSRHRRPGDRAFYNYPTAVHVILPLEGHGGARAIIKRD